MNWKEFFKPALKKIIVFIVLFIIFAPFIYYDTGTRCIQAPCPAGKLGSILSFFLFSPNHYVFDGRIRYYYIPIEIVLSYLVSCIAIYYLKKQKLF